MLKDEIWDLKRVARKINGLRTVTRTTKKRLVVDERFRVKPARARWAMLREWAGECLVQLNRIMAGFYPKRLVRRLQRVLRYVDGVLRKVLTIPADIPDINHANGTRVVRRADEASIFAQLMALPLEKGQLLC